MAATAEARLRRRRGPAGRAPAAAVASAIHVQDGHASQVSETVAAEVPVALVYNRVDHVVMMATPADLEELAVGFSLSEGIVGRADEIEAIERTDLALGIRLALRIPEHRAETLFDRQRNLAGRTGCGLCGIVRIEEALRTLPPAPAIAPVPAAAIGAALADLPARQPLNRDTGAVHAAAFADRSGAIRMVREDVGRHNALDKLIGAMARSGWNPADGLALVTSRCSMEMVQKAATFGFAIVAAISAPTSLAIELAEDCGLTLVAFARGRGFNIYVRPDRIKVEP